MFNDVLDVNIINKILVLGNPQLFRHFNSLAVSRREAVVNNWLEWEAGGQTIITGEGERAPGLSRQGQ